MLFLNKTYAKKILTGCLSFVLAIAFSNVTNARTLGSDIEVVEVLQQSEALFLSQISSSINFGGGYYGTLSEADRFYKQGDLQTAKQIQQKVKPDFPAAQTAPTAETDISQLDAKGQQYWNTANQTLEMDPEDDDIVDSQIFEPLENLVAEYSAFVPGHILLTDSYDLYGDEKNALSVISNAAELYPDREDIIDTKIDLLLLYGKPLEASISAREYAYSNPDSPKAIAYETAADGYFKEYQKNLKTKIATSGILGGIGQVATGNQSGGLEIGQMLLAGEIAAGQSFSQSIKSQSKMVNNEAQLEYLNGIGQKLAKLMGRDEFTYEFDIVDDPTPNAFALPGGKIFFHTGMLQLMDSEAELAGVLAHEIAHSVLSHSYKQIGESALTGTASNLLSSVVGRKAGLATQLGEGLLSKKFSRGKEKQSDVLGLRVLNAAGYSADGLYNVMAKLKQLSGESSFGESLLSSHPAPAERMRYLEELIQTKGYNRYGYEGVEAYRAVFPR